MKVKITATVIIDTEEIELDLEDLNDNNGATAMEVLEECAQQDPQKTQFTCIADEVSE